MSSAARLLRRLALSALLAGCGDDGASSVADGGVCGTHSNPGILTLSGLAPAQGATVLNRNIAHSFTVVQAPANFYSLELIYGDGHTAGVSAPEDPKFLTTVSGSDVNYQMIVDGWSNAPSHVVLNARSGYDTREGCAWVFPSPLFDYEVTPVPAPDGGAAPDSKPAPDSAGKAVDAVSTDGRSGGPYDLSWAVDVFSETPGTIDMSAIDAGSPDISVEPDVPPPPLDAYLD